MTDNNAIEKATMQEIQPLRDVLESEEVYAMFVRAAGKHAGNFVISILNAATANPQILKCEARTVINAGLTAANMGLSLSPSLGQGSIQPYKKSYPLKKDGRGKVTEWGEKWSAEFAPMVRGYKAMALRTRMYVHLNDFAVSANQKVIQDQVAGVDRLEGGFDAREKITHYGAYLKLVDGYEHCIIWPVEKILEWGMEYSPTYDKKANNGQGAFNPKSRWVTHFDEQARKTVMKYLIKHHGIISEKDQALLDAAESNVELTEAVTGEAYEEQPIDGKVDEMDLLEQQWKMAYSVKDGSGKIYGKKSAEELQTVIDHQDAPEDKKEAARVILEWREKNHKQNM